MDRNFHTDDFERLLREKSDEFRMYPSKRIWHSVYNNIHPGRKWPSVAMSIVLITALFLVGYLNTKNANSYAGSQKNLPQPKLTAQAKSPQPLSKNIFDNPVISSFKPGGSVGDKKTASINDSLNNYSISNSSKDKPTIKSPVLEIAISGESPIKIDQSGTDSKKYSAGITYEEEIPGFALDPIGRAGEQTDLNINIAGDHEIIQDDNQSGTLISSPTAVISKLETLPVTEFGIANKRNGIAIVTHAVNPIVEINNSKATKKEQVSAADKEWIENYALYHKPATKKWAGKLAWQMYATPSVVYRSLYTDKDFGSAVTAPLPLSSSNADINKAVIQRPSFGFEIGTGLLYPVFKGVKLKVGMQLNYTRYNAEAFQNTHPVAAKLTMHDYETGIAYEVYRTTPYSNKNGLEAAKLHNETFQVSLPMGADLKLMGNDYLQWNVGVTIQPTYVPFGKSYLISSDRRNYIKETSMLNRWNVNAGFETFISYKADNGLTYQVGPQFRKQLFTTNNKQIAVEEKLLNYGVKFGITKTLK